MLYNVFKNSLIICSQFTTLTSKFKICFNCLKMKYIPDTKDGGSEKKFAFW